jgi:16S rRNA (cytidine1402-2'-O)-methyltransferase
MGSGMNGQSFTFHGYLPKDRRLRIAAIQELENTAMRTGASQVFIETPFRNRHILQDIVKHCNNETLLCLGTDLTLESESMVTRTIGAWEKTMPQIDKRPTVFILAR